MKLLSALFLTLIASISNAADRPRFAKAPISHLNYIDTENKSATPVVFIHAFPMTKNMWDEQIEFLKKDYRVIAFDIRGLGKSKLQSPYTLEFVVDDLVKLLDQLKIEKAVVVGLSMGGYVALRAVERNPEHFRALVLADTKSEPDTDAAKLSRYKALATIQDQGVKNFVDGFIKNSVAPSTVTEKPDVFKRANLIASSNNANGVSSALLALISRTDTTASLAKIQIPTLILHGELDTVIPLAAAQSLNEKIKGSKLVTIPKAGHLSNLENAEAFNSALGKFLTDL